MNRMITIDEAFRLYERDISPLPIEKIPLDEVLGRVLAEDVRALVDLPPFRQSAMDGYALRSADTEDAAPQSPVRLKLVGEIPAGQLAKIPELRAGEAVRIFTGGYVPAGADAILRQEDTLLEGGRLLVREPVPAGKDLRGQGEEIRAGALLASKGQRLTAGHLAALAIAGVGHVRVRRQPRITVLTTGDEVVPPGQELEPGQVYDANRPLITSWLRAQRYSDLETSHLPDDLEKTIEAVRRALETSDLVLTAGGVSVGDRDYVLKASERVGVRKIFWKVKQRPGKPLFFGLLNGKPLLGLPGNPGSAFVCLVTHGRRVLDVLEGASPPGPRFYKGRLGEPLERSPDREWWVRCRTEFKEGEVWLRPLPRSGSHMITNLTECTTLARIPTGAGMLEDGSSVLWTSV
jgi:molybdopterin molybdotransferase